MGALTTALGWLRRTFGVQKSTRGEKLFSRLLGTGGLTFPGAWSSDRTLQARSMSGWNYVAVNALCEELAAQTLKVARVHAPGEAMERARKSGRVVKSWHRRKAMLDLQPHEELEAVDRDHPLYRLLKKPNPYEWGGNFYYRTGMYLRITGIAYWWKVRDDNGTVCELWNLPSQWVWPKYGGRDSGHLIEYYELRPYGLGVSSGRWLQLAPDDLIQFVYPNPTNPLDGLAPVQAGSKWIDIEQSIASSQWNGYKAGSWPGLIIKLAEQGYADMDPSDLAAFRAEFEALYASERNVGRPVLLPPGMEVEPGTQPPNQMMWQEAGDQNKDWVLALHKVGKSIAGINEEVNRATAIAARKNFVMSAVGPLLRLVDGTASETLAKEFDGDLIIYHQDETPEDPDLQLKQWEVGLSHSCVAPNEFRREVLGLEPFEAGGDDPLASAGLVPIPLQTGEDVSQWLPPDAQGGQGAEVDPTAAPESASGQPQINQTDQRAELLDKSGGIDGVIGVISQLSAGAIERPTAVGLLVLFYGLSEPDADKLIGESGKPKPQPGLPGTPAAPGTPGQPGEKPQEGAPPETVGTRGRLPEEASPPQPRTKTLADFWAKVRDAEGHEHGRDGRFASGGGGGALASQTIDGPAGLPGAEARAVGRVPPPRLDNYVRTVDGIMTKRMPAAARERAARNVKAVKFHNSVEDLNASLLADCPGLKPVLDEHDGYYALAAYSPARGTLYLDGNFGGEIDGVYAHELGHAIDGPDFELSGSPGWRSVWAEEVRREKSPPLSHYANTSGTEAFAEMCQAVYHADADLAEVERRLPRAAAFFKEHGLWPTT